MKKYGQMIPPDSTFLSRKKNDSTRHGLRCSAVYCPKAHSTKILRISRSAGFLEHLKALIAALNLSCIGVRESQLLEKSKEENQGLLSTFSNIFLSS